MTDWTGNGPNCVEMSSGAYVDIIDPQPHTIRLDDIAHHLAQSNRYNGAPNRPLSVAEHTLLVADRCRAWGCNPPTILRALHHDDAEAYLGDIVRPVKAHMPEYKAVEARLEDAIWSALNLPTEGVNFTAISNADDWAIAAESWHLMPSRGRGWFCEGMYDPDDAANPPATAWLLPGSGLNAQLAERIWLAQHHRWSMVVAGVPFDDERWHDSRKVLSDDLAARNARPVSLRELVRQLLSAHMAGGDLVPHLNALEDACGLRQQDGS